MEGFPFSSFPLSALDEEPKNSVYGPLDPAKQEIRIAVVLGQSATGTVICRLNTVSLLTEPPPKYEAISWCWGDPTPKKIIELDGQIVRVSRNVDKVLRRLCLDHGHRRVWLDAICINQRDQQERTEQVAIMGEVYSKAQRTLVWLGESDHSTPAAVEGIRKILNTRKADLPLPPCDWSSIISFFSAPWFGRVWVVQEVCLARRRVLYFRGNDTFKLLDLKDTIDQLYDKKYWDQEYCGGLQQGIATARRIFRLTERVWAKKIDVVAPLPLTMSLLYLSATEPHDKVYGMLGVLQHPSRRFGSTKRLIPDYKEPLHRVFTAAIRLCLESRSPLMLLRYVGKVKPSPRVEHECALLPSWVPPLECQFSRGGMVILGASVIEAPEQGADDGLDACITECENLADPILRLQGIEVDDLLMELIDITFSDRTDCFRIFHKIVFEVWPFLRTRFEDDCSLRACFALALVRSNRYGNRVHSLANDTDKLIEQFEEAIDSAHRAMQQHGMEYGIPENSELMSEYWYSFEKARSGLPYFNAFTTMADLYKLFLTTDGHLVMTPRASQVGDTLCIFCGAKVPFILRRENDHWIFLGEAYVPDLMEGQYVRQLRSDGQLEARKREFEIH